MGNPYAPPDPTRPPASRAPRPAAPPAAPPPPQPPDPAGTTAAQRLARTAVQALIASLLVSLLPSPWNLTMIAFALLGGVYAVRAAIRASRARAPRLVGASSTLALLAVVGLSAGLVLAVTVQLRARYEDCLTSAVTVNAQHACEKLLPTARTT